MRKMSRTRRQPKDKATWRHRPEGWKRKRWLKYNRPKTVNGQRVTGKYVPARGLLECEETEYITNRVGRVMKDPDTGHLAYTRCHKTARWMHERITYLDLHELGIAGMTHSTRYCDRHAAKHGAPVAS